MAAGRDKFTKALKRLLQSKEDKLEIIPGMLGRYNLFGIKQIEVPNRPGFVYVRVRGQTSEIVEAFNDAVGLDFGLAILLIRDKLTPRYYRVLGRNVSLYESWDDQLPVPRHGAQHSFNAGGWDIVWIYRKQMVQPLQCHPQAVPNMTVYVEADFYFWSNEFKYWAGGSSTSLTPYVPGSGLSRYVTVYLDGDLEAVQFKIGTTFSTSFPPADIISFIPEILPTEGIPLAAVLVTSSTTSITWDNLFDLRIMLFTGSGALPGIHGLDPVHGFHSGTLDAEDVTLADVDNNYSGGNLEQVMDEVADRLSRAQQLHHLSRWRSASGTTELALSAIAEMIEDFTINGFSTDPQFITLSGDGSKITMGQALKADSVVTAKYVVRKS